MVFIELISKFSNFDKATAAVLETGDLSRVLDAVPTIGAGTEFISACTRKIPVVGQAAEQVNSLTTGSERLVRGALGSGINNICPAATGRPCLTGSAYVGAKISEEVYKAPGERSSFRDREGNWWHPVDWQYLPHFDDHARLGVFHCPALKAFFCGCRGTQDCQDINSDIVVAFGGLPPDRCASVINFVIQFKREREEHYRDLELCDLRTCGHSLGGLVAGYSASYLGLTAEVFNPYAGINDGVIKGILDEAGGRSATINVHRIRNDVASAFYAEGSGITIKEYSHTKKGLAHSLSQFLP